MQGSSGTGAGVAGFSGSGTAVFGLTSGASASAVSGENLSAGDRVSGSSANGTGVMASGKTALKVQGPAVFSRSGILTVAAGHSSAKKTRIALASASFVLATALPRC